MSASTGLTETTDSQRGWIVMLAGTGINLALGVLYTWSMFKGAIEKNFGWKGAELNDPYALCCLVFAFTMIIAGKCQDQWGPRITATLGGILVGAGLFLVSTTTSYALWLLGFGLLVGAGIGFGYSSTTPPALKWFPPAQTGLIAGIVVAGFGLAPVYLAPLTEHLVHTGGVPYATRFYAIFFFLVVVILAQFLQNPPAGFLGSTAPKSTSLPSNSSLAPQEVIQQPSFWLLWVLYFIGAGAGLMVIGSVSGMAKKSMGEAAFIAVSVMAIGNAGGRVLAGVLSDRIGRKWTLLIVLLAQAILMWISIPVTASHSFAPFVIVLVATLIGLNYGANLALFPSFAKDLWGLKNFGMNYGLLFTAWGVGGFALSRWQQTLTAAAGGSFQSSFFWAGCLLVVGAILSAFIPESSKK